MSVQIGYVLYDSITYMSYNWDMVRENVGDIDKLKKELTNYYENLPEEKKKMLNMHLFYDPVGSMMSDIKDADGDLIMYKGTPDDVIGFYEDVLTKIMDHDWDLDEDTEKDN